MQQGQIGVVARFAIHPQRHDEFEKLARDATAFVQANEPDGLVYEWHVAGDRASAALFEVWASPDALVSHLQGAVGTEILPKIFSAAEMTGADFFGQVTPELLAAVDGLPVTTYGTLLSGLER